MLTDAAPGETNHRNSYQHQTSKQNLQNNQISSNQHTQTQQQKKNAQMRYSNSHYSKSYHQKVPFIVGVHYKVGKKIGEGSFGVIYEGINTKVYFI